MAVNVSAIVVITEGLFATAVTVQATSTSPLVVRMLAEAQGPDANVSAAAGATALTDSPMTLGKLPAVHVSVMVVPKTRHCSIP